MPNWSDILGEITDAKAQELVEASKHKERAASASDTVRRKYLAQLHEHTGRNVIAYYSGWLSKPGLVGTDITDEDKNGFMMAVHRLDRARGLDLILHTPGGALAAAESIVDYLRRMFNNDVRAIVPQLAMSAGTMIACASKAIVMGKHSNLGPIDPQLRGLPAQQVLDEFEKARQEIAADPSRAFVWRPILEKYHPTFLAQCSNAVNWSKEFVRKNLVEVMFAGDSDRDQKAKHAVDELVQFGTQHAHDRHLHIEDCERLGLKIERLEVEGQQALQDLVLTVHHCFMHSLSNTPAFKIIENHLGTAFIKQHQVIETVLGVPQMQQLVTPDPPPPPQKAGQAIAEESVAG